MLNRVLSLPVSLHFVWKLFDIVLPFKHQPNKMVLIVFEHFVGLALKGLSCLVFLDFEADLILSDTFLPKSFEKQLVNLQSAVILSSH